MGPLVGPFSIVEEGKTLSRESRGYYQKAIITTKTAATIVEAIPKYKALTRSQLALLYGFGDRVERTLKVLWTLGYLDRLAVDKVPPLYCAGPALRARYGLRKEEWRLPDLLRLAAANQLVAALGSKQVAFGYEVSLEAMATAYLTLGERKYTLLAPRICRGEVQWCRDAVWTHDPDDRVIVVAATEEQALEVAEILLDAGPQTRFTWDAILKDRAVFYRYEKGAFEIEKEY